MTHRALEPSRLPARLALAAVAVAVAGCSTHTTHAVAWTDHPARTWATVSSADTPTCSTDDLEAPEADQTWGGIWHGQTAGSFTIRNKGLEGCMLQPPATGTLQTSVGQTASIDIPAGLNAAYLGPGERVHVTLLADPGCSVTIPVLDVKLKLDGLNLEIPTNGLSLCPMQLTDFLPADGGDEVPTPLSALQASIINSPATANVGDDINITVRLENPTDSTINLDPCPSYEVGLKSSDDSKRSYQLNCDAAVPIAAHGHEDFDIHLTVPAGVASGTDNLYWHPLVPVLAANPSQSASVSMGIG